MPDDEIEPGASNEAPLQTILLVEDDEDIGAFLTEVLKEVASYTALHVTDAVHALEAVKSIRPRLFILDYGLPGIDGLSLADQLHTIPEYESVPVLMISAAKLPKKTLHQEHITFLPKPFDVDEFLKVIDKLIAS